MPQMDPVFYELIERDPDNWNLKKVQILHGAIEVIAHEGIEKVTFEYLAKKLKISRSHTLYYFSTKRELLENVIKFISGTAQSITVECVTKAPPKEKVLAVAHGAFQWAERFPNQVRVMLLFYYYCGIDDSYRKTNLALRETGQKRLASLLAGSNREVRAEHLKRASAIQSIVAGFLVSAFTSDDLQELALYESQCVETIRRLS